MSFSVSGIRAEDLAWSNSEIKRLLEAESLGEEQQRLALDEWFEESEKLYLFSEPFGADGTVYRYWSTPASRLGLPMLASIYDHGLMLETPSQMEDLEQELTALEAYWDTHPVHLRDRPPSGIYGHEREHLSERMGYLREALRIARDNGAAVVIS